MNWLRLYYSVAHDPKLQMLDGDDFKSLITLWCLAGEHDQKGGRLPEMEQISFVLRRSPDDARTVVERLCERCLIDKVSGGTNGFGYAIHGWRQRQYKSDNNNQYVKDYRERRRNLTESPSEQNRTETETEQRGERAPRASERPPAAPPSEAVSRMAQASEMDSLFAAVLDVCAIDYNCSPPLWKDVERVVASSHAAGRDAASIRAQAEWFKQNHWRGKRGELPAPKDLLDTAVQFGRGVITGGGGNGLAAAKRRMLDRIKSGPDNS